jgi:N-glycosidase YbiA
MIHFFDESAAYGFLSNFAACPIYLDGALWPTTEHFYQAMKYAGLDNAYAEAVRCAPSPLLAKQITRDPAHPPRADWDVVRDAVMLRALRAKFGQHAQCRAWLLATGDATLIEHTPNDAYWADGPDGNGRNTLGTLLMQVRRECMADTL